MAGFSFPLAGPLGGSTVESVPVSSAPTIDPVALALARLPQQYRGEDDEPTELLVR
jgi:hypothetical protein